MRFALLASVVLIALAALASAEEQQQANAAAAAGTGWPQQQQAANDDDEFAYDPDEFVGFKEAEAPAPAATAGQHVPTSPTTEAVQRSSKTWKDFIPEFCGIAFILLYGITYLVGKRTNMKLATIWYRGAMGEFEKNFAWLGRGETSEPQMWKESQSLFQFYASGRLHCESCSVKIEMAGRQDLLSVLYNLVQPQKDIVTMEFAMGDDTIDNLVLAVMSRRDEKAIRQEKQDIDKLAKRIGVSGLNEALVCYTDTSSAVDSILQPFVDRLSHHHMFLRCLHISDRCSGTTSNPKRGIRMEIYLNPTKVVGGEEARVAGVKSLTKLAMAFVDRASTFRLATKEREKTKALRSAMLAEDFKNNAKAREEDIMRRKKEALDKMSPEEQAKVAEKNAKREAKKASKMFRVVKMKG